MPEDEETARVSDMLDALYKKKEDNPQHKCSSCNDCNNKGSTETIAMTESPEVLCVHLVRFDEIGRKDGRNVSIPMSFVLGDDADCYNLIAMANHHGETMDAGHYTAVAIRDNVWYTFNDENVARVPRDIPSEFWSADAYLLFYKKCQNQSPRRTPRSLRRQPRKKDI